MRSLLSLLLLPIMILAFSSCNNDNKKSSDDADDLIFESMKKANSPCTDCYERARNNYVICLNQERNDENKKKACLSTLQNAVSACEMGPCPGKANNLPTGKMKEISVDEAIRLSKKDLETTVDTSKASISVSGWGFQRVGDAYTWYGADPICSWTGYMCPVNALENVFQSGTCTVNGQTKTTFYIQYQH